VRRMRLIKIVVPEIVAYFVQGKRQNQNIIAPVEWVWLKNINAVHTVAQSWRGGR
jgi:hypothetical protein